MTNGRVDLNCDLGESFGRYVLGDDEQLMAHITSANIACGLHAGDPLVIDRTVRLAAHHSVAVGAHPGYPDLQGFGRRLMDLTPEEAETFTLYQVAALAGFARANGVALVHVKPHGALYNQAAQDPTLAAAVVRGIRRFNPSLIVVGLAGSVLVAEAQSAGMRAASEGFPDRAYNSDGTLRSRRLPGALIEEVDEICAQAVRLATHGIVVEGRPPISIDTLCLHGDHPGAAGHAAAVRRALEAGSIQVKGLVYG